MTEYAEVVEKYRRVISDVPIRPVSYRLFAEGINKQLKNGHKRGGPHWQAVAAGKYPPEFYMMWYLVENGHGWVRDFAIEMVALLDN